MSVLTIIEHPSPILRQVAEPVLKFDAKLDTLIQDMLDTLRAVEGLGLAATQVGVPLRLFVAELPSDHEGPGVGKTFVLCNPEITRSNGEQHVWDACLSVPGWTARVARAGSLTVKARDRAGRPLRLRASGLLAHCFQHEIDHLDGILFLDRVDPSALRKVKPEPQEPVN